MKWERGSSKCWKASVDCPGSGIEQARKFRRSVSQVTTERISGGLLRSKQGRLAKKHCVLCCKNLAVVATNGVRCSRVWLA